MKTIGICLSVFAALFLFACKQTNVLPDNDLDFDCADNQELCDLTSHNNDFGFELMKKLHSYDPGENIFISPLSISAALSMTVNGAKGDTKAQMLEAMQLSGWNVDHLNQAYKDLLAVLSQLDDDVLMEIANSIWYRQGFSVRPEFLEVNSVYYDSEVEDLDFGDPGSVDVINGWVDEKTHGLIDQILDVIPPETVMYLINAIYFKGKWLKQFEAENTVEEVFVTEAGINETVDMMQFDGKIHLPYYETDEFQAVDLAYGDSVYSMSILLPKGAYSLDQLIGDLNVQNWETWINSFVDKEIYLRIPKFSMEYEKKLNRVLKDMGMQLAFSPLADLSGINGNGGLNISEVRHKSFIEVDEAGTEAAAVTIVGIELTSVGNTPYFIANKPFLFVIRDNKTKSVLFIGKMMNPNS